MESDVPPFTMKATKTKTPSRKGKQRETQNKDFEEEKAWLLLKDVPVTQKDPVPDGYPQNQAPGDAGTSSMDPNVPPEEEGGLECGCCFSLAPFVCFSRSRHPEPIS